MVPRLTRWARRAARPAVVTLLGLACMDSTVSGPKLIGEGRRVLFIGNSYLYVQNIPGIVQAMADSAKGDKLAVETVAGPNMALVDHLNWGPARNEVLKGGWEWVVLQQGPSSVQENRDTLRAVTQLFADLMAPGKAKPALFSAWPTSDRRQDFPRAIESYSLAASDVSGLMLPVASAWLGAWSRDSTLQLYLDGLHPSIQGAYLSALVVYGRLLGKTTTGLPAGLRLRNGATLTLPADVVAILQAAADSALAVAP